LKISLSQYKLYSADELRHYVDSGLISLEGASEGDFKGFCEKLVEKLFTPEEVEEKQEEAYKEGQDEGLSSYNKSELRRAIEILEDVLDVLEGE
jgi:hypothetical protein